MSLEFPEALAGGDDSGGGWTAGHVGATAVGALVTGAMVWCTVSMCCRPVCTGLRWLWRQVVDWVGAPGAGHTGGPQGGEPGQLDDPFTWDLA